MLSKKAAHPSQGRIAFMSYHLLRMTRALNPRTKHPNTTLGIGNESPVFGNTFAFVSGLEAVIEISVAAVSFWGVGCFFRILY
ncbi:predicted protein [Listeria monocytogenes FSL J2-071]|nr:predicted protein [Listeria monocytogenes FSL J2-071]